MHLGALPGGPCAGDRARRGRGRGRAGVEIPAPPACSRADIAELAGLRGVGTPDVEVVPVELEADRRDVGLASGATVAMRASGRERR